MAEDTKDRLVTANRILANEGIIRGFGHVSVRDPEDPAAMYISRSRSPGLVSRGDILRMDFDGEVLDDEDARTYGETVIHRAVYRNRPDVEAVVHHHAPEVMPFTVSDVDIRPAFHPGALFADGVPTFDDYDPEFGRLVVTEAEGERMAAVLGDCRAQLIESHGANVVGASLREAIISTYFFVMNAAYQFQAEQLGSPRYFTGPEEMVDNTVEDVILTPLALDRIWEMLERSLPDGE